MILLLISISSSYLQGFLDHTYQITTAPFRFRSEDWSIAVIIGANFLYLYNLDEDIISIVPEATPLDLAADLVRPWGEPRYLPLPIAGLFLYGNLKKDSKLIRASLASFESLVISSLLTVTLKYLCHRHRPPAGPYNQWDGPSLVHEHLSFPSGHAATSFAVFTTFARVYQDRPVVSLSCYTIAGLISLFRIYDREHWPSDIYIGSLIGLITARTVIGDMKRLEIGLGRLGLRIVTF